MEGLALHWVAWPVGIGLIALGVLDISLTVLHIQDESPVSNWLHRVLWWTVRGLVRPFPRRARDRALSWGMPLMVGSTIGFWAFCHVLGFALLLAPLIHDPTQFAIRDGATETAFGDAFYFSAVSYFTIGFGDLVPLQRLPRALAVAEGAAGLLTISFSVAYLISVYPAVSRKIALAAALNQETAGRADAAAVAERYIAGGFHERLSDRMRLLNDELLSLSGAHGSYPLLFYARPREVHESFVRVLVLVQGWVATLRYALDPHAHQLTVRDPRLLILEEGLLYALHALSRSSKLHVPEQTPDPEYIRSDYAALLTELARRGLTPRAGDDDEALAAYARFRAATDPYIRAYAAHSAYPLEEVYATFGRWARDAAQGSRHSDSGPAPERIRSAGHEAVTSSRARPPRS